MSIFRQKSSWSITVLVFLAICLPTTAFAQQRLKVGFIAPLSGSSQVYGIAAKNGFELALQEIGKHGITVVYEDDQFKPGRTVAAFKKLTALDKVDLIITIASTPSHAVAPLAEAKRIPHLAWASDKRVAEGRRYVIRSYPSGKEEGAKIAERAERFGYHRMALFTSMNDYSESVRKGITESSPVKDILFQEEFSADATDFKASLLRARTRGARQLAICLDPGQVGIFARQARELGITFPIFGCESLHNSAELQISNNALQGAWFATIKVMPQFSERYKKIYGYDDAISAAAIHYDIAHLLHAALQRCESKNELIPVLLSMGAQNGAIGSYEVVREGDDQYFKAPLVIRKVVAGGFEEMP